MPTRAFRQAEIGILRCNDQIARQREFKTAAEREAR